MRNILLVILVFVASIRIQAREIFTLEATLDGYVYPSCQHTISLFGLGKNMFFPQIITPEGNTIKAQIYNEDYSLYADVDVALSQDDGFALQSVFIISSLIPSSNYLIVAIECDTSKKWGDDAYSRMRLYNDQGQRIFDFGETDGTFMPILVLFYMNDSYKLAVAELKATSHYVTRVYKVDSDLVSDVKYTSAAHATDPIGVYSIDGQLVGTQANQPGHISTFHLPRGICVLRSAGKSEKILVK